MSRTTWLKILLAACSFSLARWRAHLFFLRIPGSRRDVALFVLRVVEVVDCDQLSVRPLNRARIAQVPCAAVAPENDVIPPRIAVIAADPRADSEWRRAISVRDRQASVFQTHH